EDDGRPHRLAVGAAPSDGEVEEGRGGGGEERGRPLAGQGQALLVREEGGARGRDQGDGENRGADRVDRDAVRPHLAGERLLDRPGFVRGGGSLPGAGGPHTVSLA